MWIWRKEYNDTSERNEVEKKVEEDSNFELEDVELVIEEI